MTTVSLYISYLCTLYLPSVVVPLPIHMQNSMQVLLPTLLTATVSWLHWWLLWVLGDCFLNTLFAMPADRAGLWKGTENPCFNKKQKTRWCLEVIRFYRLFLGWRFEASLCFLLSSVTRFNSDHPSTFLSVSLWYNVFCQIHSSQGVPNKSAFGCHACCIPWL